MHIECDSAIDANMVKMLKESPTGQTDYVCSVCRDTDPDVSISFSVFRQFATVWWKEGNVLFNDALNTFYLWLYVVKHMVKDHSDCERGNLPPHTGYSFPLAARVLLYASSQRQDNTYHSLCYTMSECSYHRAISRSPFWWSALIN